MFRSKDLTPTLFFCVIVAAFGSAFQHGYHTGVLNAPQETIENWLRTLITDSTINNAKEQQDKRIKLIFSVIVSIYCIGGMIGGILTKLWIAVFGLKWGIVMNNVLVVISAALMGFSVKLSSYITLIIGRFLIGINNGLNGGMVPIYLSEISPVNLRGGISSFYQVFLTGAIVFAQIVSTRHILGYKEKWPYLFAIPLIPSLIQIVLLSLCPDSPRHLIILKKEEAAKKALKWFRRRNETEVNLKKKLDELKVEIETENKMTVISVTEMFSDPILRKPLFHCCMMMIAQQFSGINGIIFYSTSSFKLAKLDSTTAQIGTLIMGATNLVMTIVSTLIVDKAGRKTLLLIGFALMFFDTLLLCASMAIALSSKNVAMAYASIAFMLLFVAFFAIGPGSIPWFLVSELFLPRARTMAASFAVPVNWLANFVIGITFPPLQGMLQSYVFLIFAFYQLFSLAYTKVFIPETKNRKTADIAAEFGSVEESDEKSTVAPTK